MKISKDECDKEFAEYNLLLCEEKCGKCDYNRVCPYLMRSYNEVVNGD